MGEDLLIHYNKVYGINFISLRLFNVFGPRSRTSGTYGAVFGTFLAHFWIVANCFWIILGRETVDTTIMSFLPSGANARISL